MSFSYIIFLLTFQILTQGTLVPPVSQLTWENASVICSQMCAVSCSVTVPFFFLSPFLHLLPLSSVLTTAERNMGCVRVCVWDRERTPETMPWAEEATECFSYKETKLSCVWHSNTASRLREGYMCACVCVCVCAPSHNIIHVRFPQPLSVFRWKTPVRSRMLNACNSLRRGACTFIFHHRRGSTC